MIPTSNTLLTVGVGGASFGAGVWAAKLVGQGIAWVVNTFFGRFDKREADLDQQEGRLNKRLEDQIIRLTERVDRLDRELEDCRRMHAEEQAARMRLEALIQGTGDAKQHAQLIVSSEKRDAKTRKDEA